MAELVRVYREVEGQWTWVTQEEAGGGGAPIVNWAYVVMSAAGSLTPGASSHKYVAGDIDIDTQSGDDFSVGAVDYGGDISGGILSAAGGQFLCTVYIRGGGSLDGSSTRPRYVTCAVQSGPADPDHPASYLGIDVVQPILSNGSPIAATCTSNVAYVDPGGPCFYEFISRLTNGVGSDEILVPDVQAFIWQTA